MELLIFPNRGKQDIKMALHRKRVLLLLISLLSLLPCLSKAQDTPLSTFRQKKLTATDTSLQLEDTLLIAPSSFQLFDQRRQLLDTSLYQLTGNTLIINTIPQQYLLPLSAEYRIIPIPIRNTIARLDSLQLQTDTTDILMGSAYNPFAEQTPLLDFTGMQYSGSFARGLSVGNRQDLVLNSSFNLQIAGELGDGIELLAAISDENIPIQPEGNTQQLREFDRIFVQLSKDQHRLTAGDYELKSPNGYFMQYFRKLQGLTYHNESDLSNGQLTSSASLAVARGKYTRYTLGTQEGNQGPYRLQGADNERFIIVLAGTEKVWLNGQALTRGIEQDYIIDYNRAEITFTAKQLITRESRIIIEFEYTSQNYLRSIYALNSSYQSPKGRIYANLYSQQDSKTSSGNLDLTEADKALISAAGRTETGALIPSLRQIEEAQPERVTYRLADTLTSCGLLDSILVRSNDASVPLYTVTFTFVGSGNGNYQLVTQQTDNETTYTFIPPDPLSCQPQGDYAPVIQLQPPQQLQLLTAGAELKLDKNTALHTEIAFSKDDLNRFANNAAENGIAVFTDFSKKIKLDTDKKGWLLDTRLQYEFKQKAFKSLNPYRAPEFLRDWSLTDFTGAGTVDPTNEHLISASAKVNKADKYSFRYELGSFLRDTAYTGLRHLIDFSLREKNWLLKAQGSLLNAETSSLNTRFFRPDVLLERTFPKWGDWKMQLRFSAEENERMATQADTLLANSFAFREYKFVLNSPENRQSSMQLSARERTDLLPAGNEFARSSTAREVKLDGNWQQRALKLRANFSYRNLELSDLNTTGERSGNTLLGRLTAGLTFLRNAIRTSTSYELGTGQEPKRAFTYLKVAKGQGNYIWLDSLYNSDGVLQPNEMEIAPFADQADYIRVTTLSEEFINTNYVNLNQSLAISPKAAWFAEEEGWKALLKRFATQSSLRISRKTQEDESVAAWNPFQLNIADSSLVSVSSGLRNILFYNRAHSVFELQLSANDNRSKIVQTTGFESRLLAEQTLTGRLNLHTKWLARLELSNGRRESDSEQFDNKDYQINFLRLSPELHFTPSPAFRVELQYRLQSDTDVLPEADGDQARTNELEIETTWNQQKAGTLRSRLSWVDIRYEGTAGSPVGFAILNGLQPGRNLLWNLSLERQLSTNLRLLLSYEGRKTGLADTVHVGRVQVAAVF